GASAVGDVVPRRAHDPVADELQSVRRAANTVHLHSPDRFLKGQLHPGLGWSLNEVVSNVVHAVCADADHATDHRIPDELDVAGQVGVTEEETALNRENCERG